MYQKIFLKLIFEDVAIKNLNFLCIENKALGMGFHEKKFWKCVLSCLFYIIFYLWSLFPIFAIFRTNQSEALRLTFLEVWKQHFCLWDQHSLKKCFWPHAIVS